MEQGGMGYNSKFKTSLCNNFSKYGNCNFGDRCKFAHGEEDVRPGGENNQVGQYNGGFGGGNQGGFGGGLQGGFGGGGYQGGGRSFQNQDRPQGICRNFQQSGQCNYGVNCRFLHQPQPTGGN